MQVLYAFCLSLLVTLSFATSLCVVWPVHLALCDREQVQWKCKSRMLWHSLLRVRVSQLWNASGGSPIGGICLRPMLARPFRFTSKSSAMTQCLSRFKSHCCLPLYITQQDPHQQSEPLGSKSQQWTMVIKAALAASVITHHTPTSRVTVFWLSTPHPPQLSGSQHTTWNSCMPSGTPPSSSHTTSTL